MKCETNQIPCISSLEELRQLLPHSTIVAMDVEGTDENVHEVGLAVGCRPTYTFHDSYPAFIADHDISCASVRVKWRQSSRYKPEILQFGDDPTTIDEDPESSISTYLQQYPSKPPLLIIWGGATELKWISQRCPKLMHQFAGYADIQILAVAALSTEFQPNLRQCLRALKQDQGVLIKNKSGTTPHRAVNDAVYTFAALAGLLSRGDDDQPLVVEKQPKRPIHIWYGRPPARKFPFTACVRRADDSVLPLEIYSPIAVLKYFSRFNPVAAGVGRSRQKWQDKSLRKKCWVSFRSVEVLDTFVSATHTTSTGPSLVAESWYEPRDAEKIREQRRRARKAEEAALFSFDVDFDGLTA